MYTNILFLWGNLLLFKRGLRGIKQIKNPITGNKNGASENLFYTLRDFFRFFPIFLSKKKIFEKNFRMSDLKLEKFQEILGNFEKIWEISDKLREV